MSSDREKTKTHLLSDLSSRVTHKKRFGDKLYKLYDAVSNRKKAHQIRKELIEAAHAKYSKRFPPIIYDARWKGKKRFKIYIPEKWD